MATLTISAAARLCHCDRRTLQRTIHAGRLHLDAQHCLSREELMATGYLIVETPQVAPHATPQETPQDTPQVAPQVGALLPLLERLASAIDALQGEIQRLHAHQPQETPQETPLAAPLVTPQTPQVAPQDLPYDPTKYVLGRLCRRGHAYGTTGKTLLRLPALQCRQCQAERARERRRAKREGTA